MFSCSKKDPIFQAGIELIEKKISYLNYLKLYSDVQNLKNLLLGKEQLILFNLMSKPVLSMKEIKKNQQNPIKDHEVNENIYNLETIKSIFEYIQNFINNPQLMTEFDKKLLSKMDKDFSLCIAEALNLFS